MFNPCLLIPVYNHGQQLPATLAALEDSGLPCLLVNDGSDQQTYNVIENLCCANDAVRAKHLAVNSGKGVAVLTGIEWARELGYSHALQIDADGQHDVNDILPMLDLAKKNPTALISGCPQYDDSVPRARLYGRYVTHVWVWIETLSLSIKDSMCGFRVYPIHETLATASHARIGHRMDFDTDIMVRMYWDDTPVLFLPTRVTYPEDGVSHFAVWKDNLRISWMHTRLFLGMLPRFFHLLTRKQRVCKTEAKPWYQQQERGAYWGMRFSLWLYRAMGRRVMNILLRFIVLYFFLFNRSARQASHDFLQRVYQDPRQSALLKKPGAGDSYRHFYHFSDAIVDRIAAWSGDISVAEVDFPDREKLRSSTRGIVVLTSHLGNADMCRALCEHANGKKINVLLHTGGAPGMNRLLQSVNPKSQVELISVREVTPATAVLLQEKIEAGEWVVIAADRLPPDNPGRTVSAMFLGREAPFPQGAFILAALLQSPVYALFCIKQESHFDIHVELLAEILPFARRQRQVVIAEVVKNYAVLLEKYCLIAPYQWFNFHNFWKSAAPINPGPLNSNTLHSDKEIL